MKTMERCRNWFYRSSGIEITANKYAIKYINQIKTINIKTTEMKKIFLLRIMAVVLMCLSTLLIKSENVASKLSCSAFCPCEMQHEKTVNNTQQDFFNRDDGFFIKI